MSDIELDGIDLSTAVPTAEILRVRRGFLGARRDVYVEIPGRPGSWVFPEEPGDRYVSAEIDILASSFALRRQAVREIADWADTPTGAVRLIVDDETDRFWDVVLDTPNDPEEWLNFATFEIVWRAAPYAQAVTISDETIAGTGTTEAGTFVAPDGVVAPPEIAVTPTNGTLTSLGLTLNGYTLDWSGSLADDAPMTISTISSTVVSAASIDPNLIGRYDPNELDMANVSGEFPFIIPGTNSFDFEWTGTATAVTFDIRWRRRYR